MSEKEKRGEVALSIAQSFQKMVLGFMPGGHVVDEFLNFRSKLKQERVLQFSESLSQALTQFSDNEIDESNFTTEAFVDIFDNVIKEVQLTNSAIKLERFKKIVVKQIVEPELYTEIQRYLLVVQEMNDIECELLEGISKNTRLLMRSSVKQIISEAGFDDKIVNMRIADDTIEISEGAILFHVNRLISLGLVKTSIVNALGKRNIETLSLSEFGESFLKFIREV